MDSEFSLDQSILFAQPARNPISKELVNFDSQLPQTDPSLKKVQLSNGTHLYLKLRAAKRASLDLDKDKDTYFDMESLYERVRTRNEFRSSRQVVLEAKKRESQPKDDTTIDKRLWSDKYRPKTFLQICPAGNERQYRLVMHWLKKWGSLVFGYSKEEDASTDELGRPLKKILLVHGPLGIGKTAVIHLLARQMGYHVEELNAANSTESLAGVGAEAGRGAGAVATLKLKIKNALTTNTITANGKPTCLIIDEVDSATNTSDIVRVLSDVLRSDSDNKKLSQNTSATFFQLASKKTSKKRFTLNRPIICIANDIYTNTRRYGLTNPMEKLRLFCEIVSFRKALEGETQGKKINLSAQKSVKAHLADISKCENLNLDQKEISEVFEVCEGDIRASINYLQFSSRKLDPALMGNITDTRINSNKDQNYTWFSLVNRLFQRDKNLTKEEDFAKIMQLISSGDENTSANGSLDKVIRGCFNQYLDVAHVQGDSVLRPAVISDWLYYYDALTTGARDSSFYPTLASLKFWSLFSDINPQKFKSAKSLIPNGRGLEFESRELSKKNRALVQKIFQLMPLELKFSFGGTSANFEFYACQFIPILDRMFSPEIGSSRAITSLTTHEQRLIHKLASLSKALDLQLETQRDIDLNISYLLFSPDWDNIVSFSADGKQEQRRRLTNSKRQWLFPLLQHEIEMLDATSQLKRRRVPSPDPENKAKKLKLTSSVEYFRNQYSNVATKPEILEKKEDFSRIWVKYHEGFSDAVRKNVGWKDLWGP